MALFTFLVCLCELKPVTVARAGGIQEVVASATFAFAIFLTFGPVPAVAAQALASLIGDVVGRKHPLKIAFNVAQYVLAWSMAGILFQAIMGSETLSAETEFTWRWGAAVIVSGATYFLCNSALVGVIIALLDSLVGVARASRGMIRREASSDVVLLALAPIVVVAAERSLVAAAGVAPARAGGVPKRAAVRRERASGDARRAHRPPEPAAVLGGHRAALRSATDQVDPGRGAA